MRRLHLCGVIDTGLKVPKSKVLGRIIPAAWVELATAAAVRKA